MTVLRRTAACVFLRERVGLERHRFEALVLKLGAPESIWDARPDALRQSGLFTEAQVKRLLKWRSEEQEIELRLKAYSAEGLSTVSCFDADFPASLLGRSHPPSYLYRSGNPKPGGKAVFVAGPDTTDAELIARAVAAGKALAALGVTLVSSWMEGVEISAHVGALSGAGSHLVFLPCGHRHAEAGESALALAEVSQSGAVYSEYPPDTESSQARRGDASRLAAGASQGVLVVGSLDPHTTVTVETAQASGVPVFYLRGLDSDDSALLRREGAYPVDTPDQLEKLIPLL